MRMSVAIPCYGMKDGSGYKLLDYSLNIIYNQTFKDFEVVVTDHSIDDKIKEVCEKWSKLINVNYYRNTENRGSPSSNTNFGFKMSNGELIKSLCQDDYLFDNTSLQRISDAFDEKTNWLVGSYYHTKDKQNLYRFHYPSINERIYVTNTLGTHSALTIRNKDVMLMDEFLSNHYDCEYYKRLYDKYGEPKILVEPTMVNYLWEGQTTNTIVNQELNNREIQYLIDKYEKA